jgi:hypothetical protein
LYKVKKFGKITEVCSKEAKMKVLMVVMILLIAVSLVGCSILPLESNLQKPVAMTKMSDSGGTDFVVTKQALWLFWGLMPISVPKIDEVIGPKIADHEGIQNLKITTQLGFIDIVISGITGGVLTSQTVIIQGKVY